MDTLTAQRGPQAADGSAVTDSPAGVVAPGNGAARSPAGAQPATAPGQAPAQAPDQQDAHAPGAGGQTAATRSCARCGAPMAAGQDWCLQCGSGAPTALGTPGWRSTAVLAAAAGALVLAAGGVGYAALTKGPRHAAVITRTVAQVTPPAAVTPPPAATPTPTPAPKTTVPATPSIPATPVVPAAKAPATVPPPVTSPATKPTETTTTPKAEEPPPAGEPIVLDTNAATTYNPENLPPASFGDPTLAIDGDPSTGWTARVEAATAPKMTAGLLVDLNSLQHVAEAELITTTPGMTVQVYGSTAAVAPPTITDPAWKKLTRVLVVHKRHVKLTLHEAAHGYRFILLWVSRAGGASAGTPRKPGRVSVNELELFPPHH